MGEGGMRDPAGQEGGAAPLLDVVFLGELHDSCGRSLLVALAESAEQESAGLFEALDQHVEKRYAEGCEAAVHALKGTGAGVGLAQFQMQSEAMLIAISQGRLPSPMEAKALQQCWRDGFAAYCIYVSNAEEDCA